MLRVARVAAVVLPLLKSTVTSLWTERKVCVGNSMYHAKTRGTPGQSTIWVPAMRSAALIR